MTHDRFTPPKKVKGYVPPLNDSCFFTDAPAEYCCVHHIYFGKGYRKLSDTWGMTVYLHPSWHDNTPYSVHKNPINDTHLKMWAQKIFEERYDHDFFMELFDVDYIALGEQYGLE